MEKTSFKCLAFFFLIILSWRQPFSVTAERGAAEVGHGWPKRLFTNRQREKLESHSSSRSSKDDIFKLGGSNEEIGTYLERRKIKEQYEIGFMYLLFN